MNKEYDRLIYLAAIKYLPLMDWRYFKSQIRQESRFNHLAVSSAGAVGLAQIMPATWAEWAPRAGYGREQPTDPEANIYTGACYMAYQWSQWTTPRPSIDRLCLAMASYNAGLKSILDAQKLADMAADYKSIIDKLHIVTGDDDAHETRTYVKRILGYFADEVTG